MKKSEIKIKALEYLQNELKNIKCKLELESDESQLVEEVIDEIRGEFSRKINNLKRLLTPGAKGVPVYEYKEGKVTKVLNNGAFIWWEFRCEFEGDTYSHDVKLLGGLCAKSNAPQVGDRVKVRCRLTKAAPYWRWFDAKICEILK